MAILSIKSLFRQWVKVYLHEIKSDLEAEISSINAQLDPHEQVITGDGTTNVYTITHGLGTRNVRLVVFRNTTPFSEILVDNERVDVNNVIIYLPFVLENEEQYKVIVSKL